MSVFYSVSWVAHEGKQSPIQILITMHFAWLRGNANHSTQVALKAVNEGNHTTEVVLKVVIKANHSIDVVLKASIKANHATDVALKPIGWLFHSIVDGTQMDDQLTSWRTR